MKIELAPIIAAFAAFAACGLSGYFVIPYLHKLKFGQTILDIGPKWHKNKQGTPTMGGIMMAFGFAAGIIVAVVYAKIGEGRLAYQLAAKPDFMRFIAGIGLALCMGGIGFIDDYIKVAKKRNLGLTARQKTYLQFLVSAVYLLTLYLSGMKTTWIPFAGDVSIVSGFGIIFWPIALMFIYGFTNAVNLTDGIDGLAATVTMIVSCFFMFAAGFLYDSGCNVFAAAVAGACAGFVLWNAHPAKVFMGDTGSMFLGGAVVAMSFGIGRPVMLIFAGILYIIEALSVMLQVSVYKLTKKRILKMAPIHHHFEMSGWREGKIVLVFSLITFAGCIVAVLPFILNF